VADASLATLRNRVLQKLKVLSGADTANAEDSTLVEGVIASVNEKLRDKSICYWPDSATPQAVLEDLAAYVACHCAEDFMSDGEATAFRQKNEDRAEAQLRRLTSSNERVDRPTRADFY